jgi:hypothetical protein
MNAMMEMFTVEMVAPQLAIWNLDMNAQVELTVKLILAHN